jgi:hypothetical protein
MDLLQLIGKENMETFWNVLLDVGSIAVIVVGALVLFYNAAKHDGPFIFVQKNWIVAIDRGEGNPSKFLANIPETEESRNWLEKTYGLYWKGYPPSKVHEFPLVHERINPDLDKNTKSEEWIVRGKEPVMTRYLLNSTTHWAKVPGIEFNGGQQGDILFEYESIVDRPKDDLDKGAMTAIYMREGKFFDALNAVINSATIQVCSKMDFAEFRDNTEKTATSSFCKEIMELVNATAPEISGLRLNKIFVYRFDSSDAKAFELAQAEKAAQIKLKTARLEAEGKTADITIAAQRLKEQFPNASEDELLAMVGQVAVADRIRDSKLISIGSNMALPLPTGENQKKGKKK